MSDKTFRDFQSERQGECLAKVDEQIAWLESSSTVTTFPDLREKLQGAINGLRALKAVLEIRDWNDSGHFNPILNDYAAVRNNVLDFLRGVIAKELL